MPAYRIKEGPSKGIWAHRFWSVKNKHGIRKRIYVQCPPEYNTTEFLRRLEREAIDAHMAGKFTTNDTFKSYVDERFLKEYPAAKNLRPSSIETMKWSLQVAVDVIGDVPLATVDAGVVARLMATMRLVQRPVKRTKLVRRRYSDQSIKATMIIVCSVLRWAARLGDISAMPNIQVPRVPRKQRPAPYTPEEVRALMAAARNPTERLLFLLLFDAGIRISEMLGLTWAQVDHAHGVLVIDRQCYRGTVTHTKSGKARNVPMSPELAAALKSYRHMKGANVFLRPDGRPFYASYVRLVLARCAKRAGLRVTRVHDGRHAFSSRLSDLGLPVFTLQKLLGHADIRTTQDYVHPTLPPLPSVMSGGS